MEGKSGTTPPNLYMSAREAAAALDVSMATLYTYVSRKKLRVQKSAGARASKYVRADVERLLAGRRVNDSEQTCNHLVNATAITLLTSEDFYYRGISAVELSHSATFEETACLLWNTGANDPFGQPPISKPPRWDKHLAATATLPTLDRLAVLLPILKAADVRAHDTSPAGLWCTGASIMRWATAILANLPTAPEGPIHTAVSSALGHGPILENALRRVLVLGADLALHPTTYAVRATANTGATPYHCVMSGLAAVTGGRIHSVRIASIARFIQEIETAQDPCDPVLVRVREHEMLPGFGYTPAPFQGTDQRARALWSFLCTAIPDDPRFQKFRQAVELATEITGLPVEFSFIAAWLGRSIDGGRSLILLRLARIAGWLAHAFEQQLGQPLIRFEVTYDGNMPRDSG